MRNESLDEVKITHLAVDFYLSKSCNKSCHYCTAWTLEMRNLIVDMTFLKNTLEMFKDHKIRINLLGGEPGLIKNLREVVAEIKKYDNFVVSVLSNSLVRKFHPWVLEDPEIYYIEHLVLDFYEDRIEKLGNYDFFDENEKNNNNLIIMTPNYQAHKNKFGLDMPKPNGLSIYHKNTILKTYNGRSPTFEDNSPIQAPEFDRRICAAFPQVPVIDFELKMIRHCSKKIINGSRQFEITHENINKMMNFELFEFENYCKKCTEVINIRNKEHILNVVATGVTMQ
jgi:hypothetical protein